MTEPLFKVGDTVTVKVDILTHHNQDKTRVTEVKVSPSNSNHYLYRVENQPLPTAYYASAYIKPYVEPLSNEEILTIFLKQHRKYAAFKRNVKYNTSRIFNEEKPEVEGVLISTFDWLSTKEGASEWEKLDTKWQTMCKDIGIKGLININLLK